MNNGDYRACCHSEPGIPSDKNLAVPVNFIKDPVKEVWNNNYYRQLRLDLINGVQNPTCSKCWQMESNGEFSFRQKSISNISEERYNSFVDDAVKNNGALSTMPDKLLQIKIGNLCNLKCIMCNQASSSLIQKEVDDWKKHGEKLPTWLQWIDDWEIDWTGFDESTDLENLYQNLKDALLNVEELQFVGGEPLVNPMVPILLENLINENAADRIKIYFITKLTKLTDKMVNSLLQFKTVTISTSWDHVNPEKFRFIRYPASYEQFRNNIDKLLANEKINPVVSFTVNIFNIFDIEQIIDEFEKISQTRNRYIINMQYVENPTYFSIRYLEPEQKKQVIDLIEKYLEKTKNYKVWLDNPSFYEMIKSIKQMLETPNVVDFRGKYILNDNNTSFDFVVKERTRVLQMYDKIRGTNYKTLFPFIKDYE